MNFNAPQTTSFFTQAGQMALSNDQRIALQGEGLVDVADFEGFDEDTLKQAFKNVRYLNPPVVVPAKCTSRLLIASMAHQ